MNTLFLFLLPALVGLIITAAFIPLNIKLAKKYGLVDDPQKNPHPKKVHTKIIPRAGGLACFLGIVISTLIFVPVEKHIIGIIAAISVLLVVGLIDDKLKNLSPYGRLVSHFLAAGLVVGSGIGISYITNPFGGLVRFDQLIFPLELFGTHNVVVIADLLALVLIVWSMHMINWSKGVDGQMPGIVMVATLFLGLLSAKLYLDGDPNQLNIAKLAFITSGVSLGFLIFNWHPAKIFPGQSGSTIFGLMIATLSILSGAKLATAGLVVLIPATDFIYTFFRRILQKKSPVWGDRGHLHHKLLDLGLTHPQIALFYIFGSAILGAIALTLDSKEKLFAAILISGGVFGFILWLNFFGGLSKRSDRDNG